MGRRAIDGFVQDCVVRVVFFHGAEVGRAFKEVDALAGGVFGADGLAVDALGGEALGGMSGGIVGVMKGCEGWNEVVSWMWVMKWKVNNNSRMRTLSFSFARNSTNAACTSASPILPILSVFRFRNPSEARVRMGGAAFGMRIVVKDGLIIAKSYATCTPSVQPVSD